jgi:hypothetical protein
MRGGERSRSSTSRAMTRWLRPKRAMRPYPLRWRRRGERHFGRAGTPRVDVGDQVTEWDEARPPAQGAVHQEVGQGISLRYEGSDGHGSGGFVWMDSDGWVMVWKRHPGEQLVQGYGPFIVRGIGGIQTIPFPHGTLGHVSRAFVGPARHLPSQPPIEQKMRDLAGQEIRQDPVQVAFQADPLELDLTAVEHQDRGTVTP